MMTIAQALYKIANAKKGKDVRQALYDGLSQCYSDVTNGELNYDAVENALQALIDAGEMAALTIADGSITQDKLDPNISVATVEDETLILTLTTSGE